MILDSGKTHLHCHNLPLLFESVVILDSGKTDIFIFDGMELFESVVILDSGKTVFYGDYSGL